MPKGAEMKERPKYQPDNLNYQHFLLVNLLRSYIKDELDEITSFYIRVGAEEIALDDWFIYVIEIAYHIGFVHSLLKEKISEVTYKNMKKLVKDNLIKRLSGGENGT